jgi:ABC-2 type transport system permease protein
MRDLLAADMHRLLWRPLFRALGVISMGVIAGVGVIVFVHSGTKHPFNPVTGLRNGLGAATTPLVLAGFILGASLIGADYPSRALTTLLTWEPRRPRVLASRAMACAAVTAAASLAVLALLLLALLPASFAHGTGPAPTATWYVSTAGLAVRCALLAAAVSVIGVSVAAIGRSTAAALAGAAVYILVVERAAIGVVPSLGRWLVITDAISWIAVSRQSTIGAPGGHANGHTVVTAGLLLLAGVVVLLGLATTVLKHRDLA